MGLWVMFRIVRENHSDDLEKEFQKRLLFKLRSLKTGMLISSEILKTNQIDSNEPVFMINRVVKRVVLIKNASLPPLKTTGLTIYPYEKNILAYLVARQSLLFVCRRPDRIGNDGPGRNTFRSKSG